MANNTKQADKLIQASLSGDVSCIEDLLSKNADVNCKNKHNQFPLLVASQNGHKEAVKLLIERGAHVNMESMKKVTSLSLASECGHHETVQILLENGAHIDHGVSDGRTPLMLASHNGHEETVRVLLSKNADVNLCTHDKETALTFALKAKQSEVAKLLVPHIANVETRDSNKLTPLMIAASNGLTEVAKLLLEKGAKLNLQSPKGSTPLMLASCNGYGETAMVLLKHGADVDLQDNEGYSALITASELGRKDVVKVLLSHNAEVDFRLHSSGKTALIVASKNGHAEIVKMLLHDDTKTGEQSSDTVRRHVDTSHITKESEDIVEDPEQATQRHTARSPPAEINTIDNQGQTALSVASSRGDLEIVGILVHHGADVNRSKEDKSALSRAVTCEHAKIVSFLLQSKATVSYADLVYVCKHGLLEMVKLLTPHCESLDNARSKRYSTSRASVSALWWAVRCGHASVVNLLLENGASVENAVMSGRALPALMIATIQGNVEIAETLLNKGADVDVKRYDEQRVTPLMLAIYAGHKDLVELFLKHGADIYFKSTRMNHDPKLWFTCMDLATAIGNQKIVSILNESKSSSVFEPSPKPMSDVSILNDIGTQYTFFKDKLIDPKCQRSQPFFPVATNYVSLLQLFPKDTPEEKSESPIRPSMPSRKHNPPPPLNLKEAYKILRPTMTIQWMKIGALLNIEPGKLREIKADEKDSDQCLLMMLIEWLDGVVDPKPSWEVLEEAVRELNKAVAQKIRVDCCP